MFALDSGGAGSVSITHLLKKKTELLKGFQHLAFQVQHGPQELPGRETWNLAGGYICTAHWEHTTCQSVEVMLPHQWQRGSWCTVSNSTVSQTVYERCLPSFQKVIKTKSNDVWLKTCVLGTKMRRKVPKMWL